MCFSVTVLLKFLFDPELQRCLWHLVEKAWSTQSHHESVCRCKRSLLGWPVRRLGCDRRGLSCRDSHGDCVSFDLEWLTWSKLQGFALLVVFSLFIVDKIAVRFGCDGRRSFRFTLEWAARRWLLACMPSWFCVGLHYIGFAQCLPPPLWLVMGCRWHLRELQGIKRLQSLPGFF